LAVRHYRRIWRFVLVGTVLVAAVLGVRVLQLSDQHRSDSETIHRLTQDRNNLLGQLNAQVKQVGFIQCVNSAAVYTAVFNRAPGQEC
jgi:hypothetical protein